MIQNLHTPGLDVIMIFISKLGNKGMVWIVMGLAMLCIKRYRKCGIVVLLSLFTSVVFGNMVLKNLVERPRPCWVDTSVKLLIHNPRDYSFPSGHTFSSFAAAFAVFLCHKKIGAAALVLAALIGFSRLYLFVHYPTDVLSGMMLGILSAFVIFKLVNSYVKM
ncbi:MAG: phosphatase PAP2 family protein [Acetivibrio sp.]